MTDGLTDGRVSWSESKTNSCVFAAVARQKSGLSESADTPIHKHMWRWSRRVKTEVMHREIKVTLQKGVQTAP